MVQIGKQCQLTAIVFDLMAYYVSTVPGQKPEVQRECLFSPASFQGTYICCPRILPDWQLYLYTTWRISAQGPSGQMLS